MDDNLYEKELWEGMEEVRLEMEQHMEITEELTRKRKAGSKKSYFEIENGKQKLSM